MLSQLSNICSRLTPTGDRNVIVISTLDDADRYKSLNGSGVGLGISPQYAVQSLPFRLAQRHGIAEQAIGNDDVTLSLSNKFCYVQRFVVRLQATYSGGPAVRVFGHQVQGGSALAERQGSYDYVTK